MVSERTALAMRSALCRYLEIEREISEYEVLDPVGLQKLATEWVGVAEEISTLRAKARHEVLKGVARG